MPTPRRSGLDALQGIQAVPLDDPARRNRPTPTPTQPTPESTAQTAVPSATPAPAKQPRRFPARQRTTQPTTAVAAPAAASNESATRARSSRSDLVPRSYVVPSSLAELLRTTSRSLNMSDSAMVNLLLAESLSNVASLARHAGHYFAWRAEQETTGEHDLTSVRVSTQTPMDLVTHLERITEKLSDGAGPQRSRLSRSGVVAMILFGHFSDPETGELGPDLDVLRGLRTAQMTRDLERRLAALSED